MENDTINKENKQKSWQNVANFMQLGWLAGDDYVAPSA